MDDKHPYNLIKMENPVMLAQWAEHAATQELDNALSYAVHRRLPQMVGVLLLNGAYVNTSAAAYLSARSQSFVHFRNIDAQFPECGYQGFVSSVYDAPRVIHQAYVKQDVESIKLLLQAGADVVRRYRSVFEKIGVSSIVFDAALKNRQHMLDLFVAHGVDLNKHRNELRQTVLYAVIKKRNTTGTKYELIDYLVRKGAHVDVQSSIYPRPRPNVRPHISLKTNFHCIGRDLQALSCLMRHEIDINANMYAGSPLRMAISKYSKAHVSRKPFHKEFIKLILDYNVDFEFHDEKVSWTFYSGRTYEPLPDDLVDLVNTYRFHQSLPYLNSLTDSTIDATDMWGKTALHRAVENGQFHEAKTLLQHGADIEIRDFWGCTPYEVVVKRYNLYARKMENRDFFLGAGSSFYSYDKTAMVKKLRMFRRIAIMIAKLDGPPAY
jgi:hypothetical protein